MWQGGGRPEEPPQLGAPQGEELPLRPVRPCLRLQPRPQAAHPLLSPGRDREVPHVSADNLGQLRVLGQCCGSVSVGSLCFWASWIRIR